MLADLDATAARAASPDRTVRPAWFATYALAVALWVGGTAVFTFLVTPILFRSFPRDLAGAIVGVLLPAYFPSVLAISAISLVAFLAATRDRSGASRRLSLALLCAALAVSGCVYFKVYPDAVAVKRQVASFERESPDSPARKEFARLHGVSMALNLFVVADAVALVLLLPAVGRAGLERR
ncbi:MAG TPA: DUF4149 domain-containing protein [Anaeromyxobacteraceae bacterium]|nr:DUF4149 domain-containing protein [Anaeromyxobacteraceae bacterium]